MIVFDPPRDYGSDYGETSHLVSTLPGRDGQAELRAFGVDCLGLRLAWLQHDGTPREHFDLFKKRVDRALEAGAIQIDAKRLYLVVESKNPVTRNLRAVAMRRWLDQNRSDPRDFPLRSDDLREGEAA